MKSPKTEKEWNSFFRFLEHKEKTEKGLFDGLTKTKETILYDFRALNIKIDNLTKEEAEEEWIRNSDAEQRVTELINEIQNKLCIHKVVDMEGIPDNMCIFCNRIKPILKKFGLSQEGKE